jgi:hypothetical protein
MKTLFALASVIALGAYAPASAQSSETGALESPVSTQELSEANFKADANANAGTGQPQLSQASSVAGNAPAAARDTLRVRHDISINPMQNIQQ